MDALATARTALSRGEYAVALTGLEPADAWPGESRAEAWLLRSAVHRAQGRQDAAEAWAARARDEAVLHGWTRTRRHALLLLAELSSGRGDARAALTSFDSLLPELRGEPSLEVRCELGRAMSARALGHLSDAEAGLRRALGVARATGDAGSEAAALLHLGAALISTGELEAARRAYTEAEALHGALGDRRGIADCVQGRAEVHRLEGDHAGAESLYRQALDIMAEIGSGQWVLPRMNLGLSLSERGEWAEALVQLRAVLEEMAEKGRSAYVFVLRTMCLPCEAGSPTGPPGTATTTPHASCSCRWRIPTSRARRNAAQPAASTRGTSGGRSGRSRSR